MNAGSIGQTGMNGDILVTVASLLACVLCIGFIFVLRRTKAKERQAELEAQQRNANQDNG